MYTITYSAAHEHRSDIAKRLINYYYYLKLSFELIGVLHGFLQITSEAKSIL